MKSFYYFEQLRSGITNYFSAKEVISMKLFEPYFA